MQTQAGQQHSQLVRIGGIVVVMSCAAVIATLLTWAPSAIGSASDNPAPARLSAMPAQAASAKEAPADPAAHGSSDSPTSPTCAELGAIASTSETERTGDARGTVGCGVRSNLAGDTPASNQSAELQGERSERGTKAFRAGSKKLGAKAERPRAPLYLITTTLSV